MTDWKRWFYTIWLGQAASFLTSAISQMALILHLTAVTGSGRVLMLASLVAFLPSALIGTFAGTLVDRWNRKLVMVTADLYIALVSLALAGYALFAELPVWLVMVVLFLRSVGAAFHTPAISAVAPLIVPPELLTKASGITQTLQTVGDFLGAAIAGVLYKVWHISGMVFLDVVGAVIASAATLSMCTGVSAPFYTGPQTALMQERIAPEYLGRVFGLYGSVMSIAMPAGLILFAALVDLIAVQHWFVISGIGCFAVGVACLTTPAVRHIEREGKP